MIDFNRADRTNFKKTQLRNTNILMPSKPRLGDMDEGVPMYVKDSNGIKQYIKLDNILYESKLTQSNIQESIQEITDNTGGNISNAIAASGGAWSDAEVNNAVASLVYKINQIIKKVF